MTAPHSQRHVKCRQHEHAIEPTSIRPGRNRCPRGQRSGGRTIHAPFCAADQLADSGHTTRLEREWCWKSNEEIPHSHIDGVSLLTVQLGTVPAWVAAAISVVSNTAGIPFGLSVPPPKDGDRDGRSFRSRPVAVASDGG